MGLCNSGVICFKNLDLEYFPGYGHHNMNKGCGIANTLIQASLVGLFSIAIAIFSYYIHRLDKQADQIAKLETSVTVILSALHLQMPNTNFDALISVSASKKITHEKAATIVPMIENNPSEARVYMKQELHFNDNEINSIIKKPIGVDEKTN